MSDSIKGSDYGILNWDSPTRVPSNAEPSSPDVSLVSASLMLLADTVNAYLRPSTNPH